jgi:hypothetical protein
MIVKITFEVADKASPFVPETPMIAESLHEALCQGIHECDRLALDWLNRHVIDITEVGVGEP